jgi:hypothetical protein
MTSGEFGFSSTESRGGDGMLGNDFPFVRID